jgi:hypothetical protein
MDFKFLETLFSRVPPDSIAIVILAIVIWRISSENKKKDLEETKFTVNRLTMLGLALIVSRLVIYFGDAFVK